MQLSAGASANGHIEILTLALSLFYSYDENTVRQAVKDITFWSRLCCSSSSGVNGIELSQLLHPDLHPLSLETIQLALTFLINRPPLALK